MSDMGKELLLLQGIGEFNKCLLLKLLLALVSEEQDSEAEPGVWVT